MANAEFYAEENVSGDVYGVKVTCTSTPNVATNSSEVTLEARLIHGVINIIKRYYPKHDCTYGIDGIDYTYETPAINRAGRETDEPIVTKTVTVQHNSDGTKSVEVFFNFPYNLKRSSDGVRVNTVTASGTFVLDQIGRASTIAEQTSEVDADGASEWRVRMNRASDQFWHKGRITFGSTAIDVPAFAAETGVVIPENWLNQMPNSSSGTAYVTLQTYSDESCTTAIGDEIATTFTVRVPSGAGPTLVSGWASYYKTTTNGVNAYVQGHTKISVMFDASRVTPAEGTTIDSWYVSLEGKTYTAKAQYINGVLQSETVHTNNISGYGSITGSAGVIDSRGAKKSAILALSVYAYEKPRITDASVFRCDADGSKNDDGTRVAVKATVIYSECGGRNSASLTFYARQTGSTAYDIEAALTSGNQSILSEGYNPQKSYEANIVAVDALGELASYKTIIGTSDVSLHIKKGGKAAAFGKYAEIPDALEVAWDLRVNKRIIDKTKTEVVGARLTGYSNTGITNVIGSGQSAVVLICDARNETVLPGLYIVNASCTWESAGTGGARFAYIEKYSSGSWASAGCSVQNFVQEGDGITQLLTALVMVEQNEIIRVRGVHFDSEELMVQIKYQIARIGALPLAE